MLKNHGFTFSPILLPRHKKPIHPTWLNQTQTKINSFCNQTFVTSFWMHLWKFLTNIVKKPWLQFLTILLPRHKKTIHPTWLRQNPTQINSFCNQTIHIDFAYIYDTSPPRLLKNHDFTFSPILLPRHQTRPIHPTCDGIFMKFFLNQCRVWGGSNEWEWARSS